MLFNRNFSYNYTVNPRYIKTEGDINIVRYRKCRWLTTASIAKSTKDMCHMWPVPSCNTTLLSGNPFVDVFRVGAFTARPTMSYRVLKQYSHPDLTIKFGTPRRHAKSRASFCKLLHDTRTFLTRMSRNQL